MGIHVYNKREILLKQSKDDIICVLIMKKKNRKKFAVKNNSFQNMN